VRRIAAAGSSFYERLKIAIDEREGFFAGEIALFDI
jgi:hypothetical protein